MIRAEKQVSGSVAEGNTNKQTEKKCIAKVVLSTVLGAQVYGNGEEKQSCETV